eukprot:3222144-Prymnesium_polylepis.3
MGERRVALARANVGGCGEGGDGMGEGGRRQRQVMRGPAVRRRLGTTKSCLGYVTNPRGAAFGQPCVSRSESPSCPSTLVRTRWSTCTTPDGQAPTTS